MEKQSAAELARDVLGDVAQYLAARSEMYAALHCSTDVQFPPLMKRVQAARLALEGVTEEPITTAPLVVDHDALDTTELTDAQAMAEMVIRGGPVTGKTTLHSARETVEAVRGSIYREAADTIDGVSPEAATALRVFAAEYDRKAMVDPPSRSRI